MQEEAELMMSPGVMDLVRQEFPASGLDQGEHKAAGKALARELSHIPAYRNALLVERERLARPKTSAKAMILWGFMIALGAQIVVTEAKHAWNHHVFEREYTIKRTVQKILAQKWIYRGSSRTVDGTVQYEFLRRSSYENPRGEWGSRRDIDWLSEEDVVEKAKQGKIHLPNTDTPVPPEAVHDMLKDSGSSRNTWIISDVVGLALAGSVIYLISAALGIDMVGFPSFWKVLLLPMALPLSMLITSTLGISAVIEAPFRRRNPEMWARGWGHDPDEFAAYMEAAEGMARAGRKAASEGRSAYWAEIREHNRLNRVYFRFLAAKVLRMLAVVAILLVVACGGRTELNPAWESPGVGGSSSMAGQGGSGQVSGAAGMGGEVIRRMCDFVAPPSPIVPRQTGSALLGPIGPVAPRPPVAADLNGDGVPELLSLSGKADKASLALTAYDGAQNVLWSRPAGLGVFAADPAAPGRSAAVASAEIPVDGSPKRLALLDGAGRLMPGWPVVYNFDENVPLFFADVTGDGVPELAAVHDKQPSLATVAFFGRDGKPVASAVPLDPGVIGVSVGDVDPASPGPEVVYSRQVEDRLDGPVRLEVRAKTLAGAVISDFTGDFPGVAGLSYPEGAGPLIIPATKSGPAAVIQPVFQQGTNNEVGMQSASLWIARGGASPSTTLVPLASANDSVLSGFDGGAAAGDIDCDGRPDVAVALKVTHTFNQVEFTKDLVLHVIGLDGKPLPAFSGGKKLFSVDSTHLPTPDRPVVRIADVDGRAGAEVIVAFENRILALNGRGDVVMDHTLDEWVRDFTVGPDAKGETTLWVTTSAPTTNDHILRTFSLGTPFQKEDAHWTASRGNFGAGLYLTPVGGLVLFPLSRFRWRQLKDLFRLTLRRLGRSVRDLFRRTPKPAPPSDPIARAIWEAMPPAVKDGRGVFSVKDALGTALTDKSVDLNAVSHSIVTALTPGERDRVRAEGSASMLLKMAGLDDRSDVYIPISPQMAAKPEILAEALRDASRLHPHARLHFSTPDGAAPAGFSRPVESVPGLFRGDEVELGAVHRVVPATASSVLLYVPPDYHTSDPSSLPEGSLLRRKDAVVPFAALSVILERFNELARLIDTQA
jgi:hypothetical protein